MSFTEIHSDCRDKIEILNSLNNDVHAQVVANLLEDNSRKELALALLICFDTKITALLSASLSLSQINLVYRSLTRQLFLIAKQRTQALNYFYQEISAAEFAYSPLGLRLNDPSWLTRLNSNELRQLTLAIDDNLLAVFLSCLAPLRVSKIIDKTYQDKPRLVNALQAIPLVNEGDVDRLLSFLDQHHNRLIKHPQHLGKAIDNLNKHDNDPLLDNPSLIGNYSSFTTINRLPTKQIVDIFSDCHEQQIAQTLFACDTLTQETILEALPEATRLGVNDQLTNLQTDNEHRTANLKVSSQLQQAISAYLQES